MRILVVSGLASIVEAIDALLVVETLDRALLDISRYCGEIDLKIIDRDWVHSQEPSPFGFNGVPLNYGQLQFVRSLGLGTHKRPRGNFNRTTPDDEEEETQPDGCVSLAA